MDVRRIISINQLQTRSQLRLLPTHQPQLSSSKHGKFTCDKMNISHAKEKRTVFMPVDGAMFSTDVSMDINTSSYAPSKQTVIVCGGRNTAQAKWLPHQNSLNARSLATLNVNAQAPAEF